MRRRKFITLVGGMAAAWPLAVRAQQSGTMRRIAVLMTLTKDNSEGQARLASFRRGLEALGWIEGRNFELDDRWPGDDIDRLQTDAAELINLQPDVIVSGGSRALIILQQQTRTIPIVFVAAAGTIEHGIVTNVARPAGNLTGFTTFDTFALAGKLAGMLKEIAPALTRVVLIMYRGHPSLTGYGQHLAADALSLGLIPTVVEVSTAAELERAMDTFARERRM